MVLSDEVQGEFCGMINIKTLTRIAGIDAEEYLEVEEDNIP